MNFLAHFYLSGKSQHIMAGNFIADFIKGLNADAYEGGIHQGILLHREIDTFTDRHPQVARSKKRLWRRHRHYSAVIVDIFYDHFLAKNWENYSDVSLEEFAGNAYAATQRFSHLLPERAQNILPRMMANNWLVHYRNLEGVDRAMRGVANRASFPSNMASAIVDLQSDYELFKKDFHLFFPEITDHAKAFLNTLQDK